jgi:SAM-dependent methyltransferase
MRKRCQYQKKSRAEFNLPFMMKGSKQILDVGCGPFGMIYQLNAIDSFKVGIDPLVSELRGADGINLELVKAVGEHLPFRPNIFDMIICSNVLEHTIDPLKILKEIAVALKRGDESQFYLKQTTFPHIILKMGGYLLKCFDRTHLHHFSSETIKCMLREVGFIVLQERIQTRGLLSRIWRRSILAKLSRWLEIVAYIRDNARALERGTKAGENVFDKEEMLVS